MCRGSLAKDYNDLNIKDKSTKVKNEKMIENTTFCVVHGGGVVILRFPKLS